METNNTWICSYCGARIPYGEMHTCNGMTFTVPGVTAIGVNSHNTIVETLWRIEKLLEKIEERTRLDQRTTAKIERAIREAVK